VETRSLLVIMLYCVGDNGCLYACRSQDRPTLVSALLGKSVVHVVAGTSHSAAVTEEGALYTWGKGARGRLGHGKCMCVICSAIVMETFFIFSLFLFVLVKRPFCAYQSTCVCLCVGNLEDKTVPTLVEKLVGHKIVGVDCGSEDAHMLALEDTGQSVCHCVSQVARRLISQSVSQSISCFLHLW